MAVPWLYHGCTMAVPWLHHGYARMHHGCTMAVSCRDTSSCDASAVSSAGYSADATGLKRVTVECSRGVQQGGCNTLAWARHGLGCCKPAHHEAGGAGATRRRENKEAERWMRYDEEGRWMRYDEVERWMRCGEEVRIEVRGGGAGGIMRPLSQWLLLSRPNQELRLP